MNKRVIFILAGILLIFNACNNSSDNKPSNIYNKYVAEVKNMQKAYPEITVIETLGKSTDGNEIYALIVSDNPTTNEYEPRVRLTGSIHGNEGITTPVLLDAVTYLLENYKTSSIAENIINNTYTVVIPAINPDGLINNSRYNSNGVDLNRNFSYYWENGSSHGTNPFSEIESQVFRDYSLQKLFHLSATFHTGETVVNIPYDYVAYNNNSTNISSEYDLLRSLGEVYSLTGNFINSPGLLSLTDLSGNNLVINGVVNGGDWYVVGGSLQDWSILETGCIDITMEISDLQGYFSDSNLSDVIYYNRDSILAYISSVQRGVSGVIKDNNDNPVFDANVYVQDGDIITSSDQNGYFHKILNPGTYTLIVEATGYLQYTVPVVITNSTSSVDIGDIILVENKN